MSIRFATEADLPAMLAIYAPYVTGTTYSFEYQVPTPEAFAQRFRAITAQFPWLVWEEAGRVLGYAYGSAPFERAAYAWCAEPSIYLAPAIHRKGVGRALYRVLEQLLRRQGYRVLYSIVTSSNHASLAFHEALGYTTRAVFPDCGYKHGQWLGTVWLEKTLDFVETPSNFPRPWREIVESDNFSLSVLDNMTLS